MKVKVSHKLVLAILVSRLTSGIAKAAVLAAAMATMILPVRALTTYGLVGTASSRGTRCATWRPRGKQLSALETRLRVSATLSLQGTFDSPFGSNKKHRFSSLHGSVKIKVKAYLAGSPEDLTQAEAELTRTQVHRMKRDALLKELSRRKMDVAGSVKVLRDSLLSVLALHAKNPSNIDSEMGEMLSEEASMEPGPVENPGKPYTLRTKGKSKKKLNGTGVGIVLYETENPKSSWTARKFLTGDRSVFEAEYSGVLVGLRYAVRRGVKNVELQIDHDVTKGHLTGDYELSKQSLVPMYQEIVKICESLDSFTISLISKPENHKAIDLAAKALATRTSIKVEDSVDPMDFTSYTLKAISVKKQETLAKSPKAQTIDSRTEDTAPPATTSDDPIESITTTVHRAELEIDLIAAPIEVIETSGPSTTESGVIGNVLIDPTKEYKLMFDGGARGNPTGKAGAGVVIYDENGEEIWCGWEFLGKKYTNNVAEYHALLLGLQCARSLGIKRLKALGDSELIVKQLNGIYKVKDPKLKEYWGLARDVMKNFTSLEISHVLREYNKRADELANVAMDTEDSYGFDIDN